MRSFFNRSFLMISILLILSLTLVSVNTRAFALSQPDALSKLIDELGKARAEGDSLQMARQYRAIGVEYTYMSQYQEALVYLEKGLEVALGLGNARAEAAIKNNMAECYAKLGMREAALALYDEVGDIYLNLGDSVGYAGFLINLSAELQDAGEIARAAETAMHAIRVKEATGDSVQLAFFYNKMAELIEITQPERSYAWLLRAYALTENPLHTSDNTTISIYNNLAKMYRNLADYDSALTFYDSVYQASSRRGHREGMEVGLSNMAQLHARLGNAAKALSLHLQAAEISRDGQNTFRQSGHLINAGRLHSKLGQYHSAIPLLQQGLSLADDYDYPEYRMQALGALAVVYQHLQQPALALEAHLAYSQLKDSLESLELRQRLMELETRYESEKKEAQIAWLQKLNDYEIKRRRILSTLLGVSLLLAGSLGLGFYFRNRRILTLKTLAEKEKEIAALQRENLLLNIDRQNRSLSVLAMKIAQKERLLEEIRQELKAAEGSDSLDIIRKINHQLKSHNGWEAFRIHFEEVHPDFFKRLKKAFPSVSANEEKLCAYLMLNLSSKEIAALSGITTAGVDKSRNRLRKKMNIESSASLRDFLHTI